METIKKEQSPRPVVSSGSKLRYPLRSSARSNPAVADAPESSASRRVRPSSSVSQSVGNLDISAKDKSAKPQRRLSIPTKSTFSPQQTSVGSITSISETRLNRSNVQGKSDTPLSESSKSASRRKFCVLSSVSYWLTQIKLSESAHKHSISLGFFKLALEAGCEPLHRIREELKSYVRRHNLLAELEEAAKDLLQRYNILEDLEQLKLSENSSLSQEETFASNLDVCSSSTSTGAGNLKPKSLISNALPAYEPDKKGSVEKRVPVAKDRASNVKNPRHPVAVKDANVNNTQKKSQKPRKVESKSGNAKVKSSTEESVRKEADPAPAEEVSYEDKDIVDNKENMDSQSMDEAVLKEETETTHQVPVNRTRDKKVEQIPATIRLKRKEKEKESNNNNLQMRPSRRRAQPNNGEKSEQEAPEPGKGSPQHTDSRRESPRR